MSAAARAMLSRESESPAKKKSSKGLRVNESGDAYEREADRVADTVSKGGRIPGWSLSASAAGLIQRDTDTAASLPAQQPIRQIGDPQNPPAPNNYGDALGKIAEAFLKTPAAATLIKLLTDQPVVKDVKDFVETPGGMVVAGSTAAAAITGLAAAGKGLPAQLPAIPLDKLYPGLKMKIDVEGPLNHPTQGSLVFSFGAASPKKKKGGPTESEKSRAQTKRLAEDLKFGAGTDPRTLGPVASPAAQQQQADDQFVQNYAVQRMSGFLKPGEKAQPGQYTPLVPGTQPISLHMRDDIPAAQPAQSATSKDASKKEDIPVQRKAEAAYASEWDTAPETESTVESVISSSGRPLDRETRRTMESRIGFDFSKVRIHSDSQAAASAKSLRARAYTVGNHVVFGPGRYAPNSTEGQRLLAHELTHVIQQAPSSTLRPVGIAPTPAPVQIQRDPEEDSKGFSISDFVAHPRESLKKMAQKIPGYTLFTVIIGKDPISGQQVERNATNLVHGFLQLVHAEDTFKNLQESGALDAAFEWLKTEVDKLGFSVQYFEGLIDQAINSVHAGDIFDIKGALSRIYEIFKPPLIKAKDFAVAVLNKVFEFIVQGVLEAVGGSGVLEILRKAGAAFSAVAKDPVAFLEHLVDALKKGFTQFKDKILEYLKDAVVDWLFGEIASTGLKIPKPFNFAAIVNVILQILGLTYPKLRLRLVKALGGEKPVAYLETAFEIVSTIATKGLAAAWELILQKADNLIETVLSAIKDWAITKIVTLAVAQLITLFNPAGAIIKAIQLVYETLKVFIEKAKQIAALIGSIADSISAIAAGNIAKAADYIEKTMAKTLPIILNFLAGVIGLGGIGEKIREVIHGIQAKVAAAIDKVLDYIIAKGRALWELGKDAAGSVLEWWKARKPFKLGDEDHTLYIEGEGDKPQFMVQSAPTTLELFLDNVGASEAEKANLLGLAKKVRWRKGEVKDTKDSDQNGQANLDLLYQAISALKVKGVTTPESDIQAPAAKDKFGGGTGIKAFLSLKHRKGTTPNKRDKPAIWEDLGSIREDKSYVRGHLLNDRLGGLGEWDNMMPLTNQANGDYYRAMEEDVINAVSTGKQLVWVEVEATYNDVELPPKGTKKEKEKKAESRLGKLIWKYGPASHDGKTWKKATGKQDPKQIKAKSGSIKASE